MQQTRQSKRQRHAGTRTCVGCGARVQRDRVRAELMRLVLLETESGLRADVDLSGSTDGRGSWVHTRPACLEHAAQKGLARSAKASVSADFPRLCQEVQDQATRRLRSLIGTARRTGRAAVGSAAVRDALGPSTSKGSRGLRVSLLLVATDAAAAAKHREVEMAAEAGIAVPYGTKAFLGEALGRGEVGVIAVMDDGIAAAIRHTIALSETFARG